MPPDLSLYLHIPFCDTKCAYCDFNSYAGLESLIPAYTRALCREAELWAPIARDSLMHEQVTAFDSPSPWRERAGVRANPECQTHPGSPSPWRERAGVRANPEHQADSQAPRVASPITFPDRASVRTVFFGGGTPSLLPLDEMARVLETLRACYRLDERLELSLEANPGTVDEQHLRGLRQLGFNRLSLGVQSFDDAELRALDRIHSAAEAEAAFAAARAAGFENVNLDLIFGLAGQDLDGWRRNVERALTLRPEHLSLYALTIEEGTALAYQIEQGLAPEPDPDLQADMYELARERLADAGYEQYEISNWALPGRACRHNLTYWRNGQWLGLGAGAHSSFGGYRFSDALSPRGYIHRVEQATGMGVGCRASGVGRGSGCEGASVDRVGRGGFKTRPPQAPDGPPARIEPGQSIGRGTSLSGSSAGPVFTAEDAAALQTTMPQVVSWEAIDAATAMADTAILGLRLMEGVSLAEFEARHGRDLIELHGEALRECRDAGLLDLDGDRLRLTERGLFLANEVFVRLLPGED